MSNAGRLEAAIASRAIGIEASASVVHSRSSYSQVLINHGRPAYRAY